MQLELWRAVFVKEPNSGVVFDGLLEVVDGDVVAEDVAGTLFTDDQRRAREGDEQRLRQRGAHVDRQCVVLTAVGLVGDHDHVTTVAEHLRRLKLLDQREDIPVIAPQQVTQLRAAPRVADPALGFAHRAHHFEGLRDLVIQLDPVGHDDERPVALDMPQDLLREEDHRQALPRSLGVPKDTATSMAGGASLQAGLGSPC